VITAADIGQIPKPITPGAEMDALARFHRDVTWTGFIAEGGMGLGTPPMTAAGRGTHEAIQDGRWVVGNYQQDQFLPDGTFVLTWQLHWVAGWDPTAKEYRATLADNYGHAEVMRGKIEGDRLVFESVPDAPVRIRLVWDLTDPNVLIWRNEVSIDGSPWALVEQYDCRPMEPGEKT
jgi:Protein of unknown function (DUF1579)